MPLRGMLGERIRASKYPLIRGGKTQGMAAGAVAVSSCAHGHSCISSSASESYDCQSHEITACQAAAHSVTLHANGPESRRRALVKIGSACLSTDSLPEPCALGESAVLQTYLMHGLNAWVAQTRFASTWKELPNLVVLCTSLGDCL